MILISRDVTDPNEPIFISAVSMLTNANGSVSFILPDGSVAGQEPNQYGVRHDAPDVPSIGVYQMATVRGALVSFLTRPGDSMFVYTLMEGTAF